MDHDKTADVIVKELFATYAQEGDDNSDECECMYLYLKRAKWIQLIVKAIKSLFKCDNDLHANEPCSDHDLYPFDESCIYPKIWQLNNSKRVSLRLLKPNEHGSLLITTTLCVSLINQI